MKTLMKFKAGKTKRAKSVSPKLKKPLPYLKGAAEQEDGRREEFARPQAARPHRKAVPTRKTA